MKFRLILFLVIWKGILLAQDSFSNYYPFDSYGSTFRTMLIENDTILLQGFFLDTVQPFLQGMAFAKVDSFGNLVSYQRYFDPKGRDLTFSSLNGMIKLSDGRYLTVGVTLQDDALQLIFLTQSFLVDTVFEYFANDPTVQVNWIRHVFEIEDGYLVFGYAQRLSFATDGQIFRIRKNGELVWRKWFGIHNKDEAFGDVAKYTDSTFIVGSFHKPFPVSGTDKRSNTWIFEVDVNGNILNEFVDPDPFSGSSGGLVTDEHRNIYYSGESIVADMYGQHNAFGRIGMLSSDFELLWKLEFGKNLSIQTGLVDMIMTRNKLIAVGSHVDSSRTQWNTPNGFISGWITSASVSGDSLCEKFDTAQWFADYGRAMGFFRTIDTLSSGSIVTCGYGWFGSDGDNYHEYAWLVKMPNPPCEGLQVSTKEIDPYWPTWRVSPNPSSESAIIQFIDNARRDGLHFNLFNAEGRIVRRFNLEVYSGQFKLSTHDLPNGTYVLQSVDKNGRLTGIQKLVVLH